MHHRPSSLAMTADLTGKVCLITGATGGIGLATACQLTAMNAEMYLISRSHERGEIAVAEIKAATGSSRVHLLLGDLAVLEDVLAVAHRFRVLDLPLHLLVNNAGVMNTRRRLTVDGLEEMFAVNHLAHFLLTNLLIEPLRAAAPARVVTVASDAYKLVPEINFEDLNFRRGFRPLKVYGHSKLANILFASSLAHQLEGTGVTSNAVHPGAVSTQLGRQNGWRARAVQNAMRPFLKSPNDGARTSVYASTAPELQCETGKYFARGKAMSLPPYATDDATAQRLWEVSRAMTKLPEGTGIGP